jgi:AraC-like DNA-binding protein
MLRSLTGGGFGHGWKPDRSAMRPIGPDPAESTDGNQEHWPPMTKENQPILRLKARDLPIPYRGFLNWLKDSCASSRRFGSVCTGVLVLAKAGLLDGRRRQIESTAMTLKEIALPCGCTSAEILRRAYLRCLGVRPHQNRACFGHARVR